MLKWYGTTILGEVLDWPLSSLVPDHSGWQAQYISTWFYAVHVLRRLQHQENGNFLEMVFRSFFSFRKLRKEIQKLKTFFFHPPFVASNSLLKVNKSWKPNLKFTLIELFPTFFLAQLELNWSWHQKHCKIVQSLVQDHSRSLKA